MGLSIHVDIFSFIVVNDKNDTRSMFLYKNM